MAQLQHVSTGAIVHLDAAEVLVGRSSASAVRLRDRAAHRAHAWISWSDQGWWLNDHHAGGSEVRRDGVPLAVPGRLLLRLRDRLEFGPSRESWMLIDDTRPPARARSGERVLVESAARAGLEIDGALVYLFEGRWWVQAGGAPEPVEDGATIQRAEPWTLELPTVAVETERDGATRRTVQLPGGAALIVVRSAAGVDWVADLIHSGPAGERALGRYQYGRLLWILAGRPGEELDQAEVMAELGVANVQSLYNHRSRIGDLLVERCGLRQADAEGLIVLRGRRIRLSR